MPLKSSVNDVFDRHGKNEDERRDQISHFILRLVYCRTDEKRAW